MNAILYVRVSTKDQRVERQTKELSLHCKNKGWSVVGKHHDVVSGAVPFSSRQSFSKALEQLKKTKDAILVVHEISRLGRNTLDVLKCIETINNIGSALNIYNINIIVSPDRSDPSANLIVSVLASLASHERELMRERIISGIRNSKKKSGRPKGSTLNSESYSEKYPIYTRLIKDGYPLKTILELSNDISYSTLKRIKSSILQNE